MLFFSLVLHNIVKEEMAKKHYEVFNALSLHEIEQPVDDGLRVYD